MAHDHRRIGLRADPNGKVERIVGEGDVAIADVQVEQDIRVLAMKRGQEREQTVVRIRRGYADTQAAGRSALLARRHLFGLGELGEGLATLVEVDATRLGQPDVPGRTDEQANAQSCLEPSHGAAYRGWRDAGRRRGGGETAQFPSQAEQFDAAQHQVVELPLHGVTPCNESCVLDLIYPRLSQQ
nr:hypothetical protein [Luteibacter rhizovicinus]